MPLSDSKETLLKYLLLKFIIHVDPNKLVYFPWYPDSPSAAFNLLAPFLQKLAPKKCLQGPLWPPSKNFWLKHWSVAK